MSGDAEFKGPLEEEAQLGRPEKRRKRRKKDPAITVDLELQSSEPIETQPGSEHNDNPEQSDLHTDGREQPLKGSEASGTASVGGRREPVLPWMRAPIEIASEGGLIFEAVSGLHPRLQTSLRDHGVHELYPVQTAAWRILAGGMSKAHDLCICAPTGSGKTLAYALPVVQSLSSNRQSTLQALIVLPTRELAFQVYNVISPLASALDLWTGLAAGKVSEAAEVQALADTTVNLLVATPGRLMAHLKADPCPVTLSGLRFLVIDEIDRLLRQSYQDWLPFVLSASQIGEAFGSFSNRLVKIIASATLTQDPAKMARLGLYSPRCISMSATDHRYKVPKQLKEFKVVCATADKPVLLMALLKHMQPARVIVFAGSLVVADRLFKFLGGIEGGVAEHSSTAANQSHDLRPGLAAFKDGRCQTLVATDALTRGMDVPGVDVIINYDPADYPKTYVHRAGRTARAGKSGTVVSLLTTEQVRHFKAMLHKVDNTYVKDFTLPSKLVVSLRPAVQEALKTVFQHVEAT